MSLYLHVFQYTFKHCITIKWSSFTSKLTSRSLSRPVAHKGLLIIKIESLSYIPVSKNWVLLASCSYIRKSWISNTCLTQYAVKWSTNVCSRSDTTSHNLSLLLFHYLNLKDNLSFIEDGEWLRLEDNIFFFFGLLKCYRHVIEYMRDLISPYHPSRKGNSKHLNRSSRRYRQMSPAVLVICYRVITE
jgi:hypothetical protein